MKQVFLMPTTINFVTLAEYLEVFRRFFYNYKW